MRFSSVDASRRFRFREKTVKGTCIFFARHIFQGTSVLQVYQIHF